MTDVSAPPQPSTTTGDRSSIQLYLSERGWGGGHLVRESNARPREYKLSNQAPADDALGR